MKISIITVNYNNSSGLEKTIHSVLSQTGKCFEYIVVDGGSTDSSVKVIKDNSQNISSWSSEPDSGIYNAMNKGTAKATGDYLMFLNSGDILNNAETLRECSEFMKVFPNEDIYYGNIFVVEDGVNRPKWLKEYPRLLTLQFFKQATINHQASLIKTELLKSCNLYPEHYKIAADYWFYLQCLLSNRKFKYMNIPLVQYDANGISSNDNYSSYLSEMEVIWKTVVPQSLQDLLKEHQDYKQYYEEYRAKLIEINGSKITNAAIFINQGYQKLKRYFAS